MNWLENIWVWLALAVPYSLIAFIVINFICVLYTFIWLAVK